MRLIDVDKLIEKLEALAGSYSDIKYSDNTIEGDYGSYNNVPFLEDNYEKEIYVDGQIQKRWY